MYGSAQTWFGDIMYLCLTRSALRPAAGSVTRVIILLIILRSFVNPDLVSPLSLFFSLVDQLSTLEGRHTDGMDGLSPVWKKVCFFTESQPYTLLNKSGFFSRES